MQDLKVVYIQSYLAWEDKAANLERFDRHFMSVGDSPDLIVLPEMFNTGFSINPESCAETMDGEGVRYLKNKAKEHGAMVMGSLLIRDDSGFVNRLIAARPDGSIETYDKRHLFRLSEEYRIFKGGDERLVIDLKGWKIRPLICYDLRFPVWSKNTFNKGEYEYDMLIYVANWPAVRSKVWTTLLSARAMENQVFCLGVNRVGEDGHGYQHSGDSAAYDARGNVISSVPAGQEGVAMVSFSRQDLELFRESFTLGLDWDRFSIET